MLRAEFTSLFLRDLPHSRVVLDYVHLVAYQHDTDFILRLGEQRIEPIFNIVKGLPVCDIVYYEAPQSFPVVGYCNGAIFLLPCRVP